MLVSQKVNLSLGVLLSGFEYGYFPDKQPQPDFETLYPQFAKALQQGKLKAASDGFRP
jgi:hypothetical protein